MNPRAQARGFFFGGRAGLVALRTLCLDARLTEGVTWGHPVYGHAARIIAIIGAFRGNFRITFMNAALRVGPEGALERRRANTRHPDALRFAAADQLVAKADVIRGLPAQAMRIAVAGIRPDPTAAKVVLPAGLLAGWDDDPHLAKAWAALTPGRQRSHVLQISNARATVTRDARVAKLAPRMLAGKGANDD